MSESLSCQLKKKNTLIELTYCCSSYPFNVNYELPLLKKTLCFYAFYVQFFLNNVFFHNKIERRQF